MGTHDQECEFEFKDPGCDARIGALYGIFFGVDHSIRDNDDGTFTHTFSPGEDDILNAEILED
jgi:hypothetical protein